eukprot:5420244-Prymnesium_polylepis.1
MTARVRGVSRRDGSSCLTPAASADVTQRALEPTPTWSASFIALESTPPPPPPCSARRARGWRAARDWARDWRAARDWRRRTSGHSGCGAAVAWWRRGGAAAHWRPHADAIGTTRGRHRDHTRTPSGHREFVARAWACALGPGGPRWARLPRVRVRTEGVRGRPGWREGCARAARGLRVWASGRLTSAARCVCCTDDCILSISSTPRSHASGR